jgi:hypothetical protein
MLSLSLSIYSHRQFVAEPCVMSPALYPHRIISLTIPIFCLILSSLSYCTVHLILSYSIQLYQVVVILNSGGGTVTGYGLAAAQLSRIKNAKIGKFGPATAERWRFVVSTMVVVAVVYD